MDSRFRGNDEEWRFPSPRGRGQGEGLGLVDSRLRFSCASRPREQAIASLGLPRLHPMRLCIGVVAAAHQRPHCGALKAHGIGLAL